MARIKQNIGGVLICQARSEADLHNFTWDVAYTYEDPDKNIYDIGGGTFFDKDWEENEQLIKFRKWTILATGNDQNSEKLIIGQLDSNTWKEYPFIPNEIELTNLWKSKNINSDLEKLPSKTTIKSVSSDGRVVVVYKYDRKNHFLFSAGTALLTYQIDSVSGKPVLVNIDD